MLVLLVSFVFLNCVFCQKISVSLTGWPENEHGKVQELAEALADQEPSLFWSFILNCTPATDADTGESLTEWLRVYAPRVEAHRQMLMSHGPDAAACSPNAGAPGEPFGALLVIQSSAEPSSQSVLCSPSVDRLEHALQAAQNSDASSSESAVMAQESSEPSQQLSSAALAVTDRDHVYAGPPVSTSAPVVTVIMYGRLHKDSCSTGWLPLHQKLAAASLNGRLRYVFRHWPAAADGLPMALAGYGVALHLKSVEYKAVDEDQEQPAAATTTSDSETDVQGFNFVRLRERNVAPDDTLTQFRDYLRSTDRRFDELRVWELVNLDLQATQRILTARQPLAMAGHLSAEFPSLAVGLSALKLQDGLADRLSPAIVQAQQQLGLRVGLASVNGHPVSMESTNLFELRSLIHRELVSLRTVRRLGVSAAAARPLLRSATATDSSSASGAAGIVRFHVTPPAAASGDSQQQRHSAIAWTNDFSRDAAYSRYPRSFSYLARFESSWMQPFPLLRQNLFSLVLVVEPHRLSSLVAVAHAYAAARQGVPFRFGLVPVFDDQRDQQHRLVAELVVRGLLLLLDDEQTRAHAPIFFHTLYAMAMEDDQRQPESSAAGDGDIADDSDVVRPAQVLNAWAQLRQYFPVGELAEASTSDPEVAERLASFTAFAVSVGLQAPAAALNGIVLAGPPPQFAQQAYERIGSEVEFVKQLVADGHVSDSTNDVYSAILTHANALPRCSRIVLEQQQRPPSFLVMAAGPHPAGRLVEQLTVDQLFVEHPDGDGAVKGASLIVLGDMGPGSPAARTAAAGLQALESGPTVSRLAVVHVPSPATVRAVAAARAAGGGNEATALARALSGQSVMRWLRAALRAYGDRTSVMYPFARSLMSAQAEATAAGALVNPSVLAQQAKLTVSKLLEYLGAAENNDGGALDSTDPVTRLMAAAAPVLQSACKDRLRDAVDNADRQSQHQDEEACVVVLVNGRVMVLDRGQHMETSDFVHLLSDESTRFTGPQRLLSSRDVFDPAVVPADDRTARRNSDVLMGVVSLAGHSAPRVTTAGGPTPQQQRLPDDENDTVAWHLRATGTWTGVNPALTATGGRAMAAAADWPEDTVCDVMVSGLLDPLTAAAQRFVPLVRAVLAAAPGACVQLVLSPQAKLSDLPLKSFYRLVRGGSGLATAADFGHLPVDRLLTLALDHHQSWLVSAAEARHDLDNIQLDRSGLGADGKLVARFSLDSVLTEGNCADLSARGAPPRGLQLWMGPGSQHPHQVDTIVMSNYGYFQLKSNPGLWQVRLAPGRSADLYAIVSTGSGRGPRQQRHRQAGDHDNGGDYHTVLVDSFDGAFIRLRVQRRPGRAHEKLLGDFSEEELTALREARGVGGGGNNERHLKQLMRMMRGEAVDEEDEEEDEKKDVRSDGQAADANMIKLAERMAALGNETIHVFSVATGHLYERFLKIMMLSVVKNTQNPVKFWLLSNFLSPQFKRFVPRMAEQYGFQVELVTYKWPSWLHAETVKQRIIWGYKILFLDVLFPIDVRKIVYIDADQVVRSDLLELWAEDMTGNVYAFTPFCSDRPDMLGFQFWRSGYWKNHLGPKPYHISALFLVNLEMFRRQAAGDQIRATYDSLAQDPNSLANLDQDLPNYLQHNVGIHSLPQHWLWCETWCSDQSKTNARTIDLCNNPQTKESKLSAAVRIIPEWTSLDSEIKSLENDGSPRHRANGGGGGETEKTDSKLHSEL